MSGSAYTPFFIHQHAARRPVAATTRKRLRPGAILRECLQGQGGPACVNPSLHVESSRSTYCQEEPVAARGTVAESVVGNVSSGDIRYSEAGHSSTSFRKKHKYVRVGTLVDGFEAGSSHLPQPDDFHSTTRSHLSGHVPDDLSNIAADVEVNVVEEGEDDMMSQTVMMNEAKSSTRFRTLQQKYKDEMRRQLIEAYDKINQLGQSNIMCQRLKSENHSLKSALAQGENRLHQLEGVVLERNFRLKQLLSENVRLSAKLKRIQSEFGVDAVKEAFNKDSL